MRKLINRFVKYNATFYVVALLLFSISFGYFTIDAAYAHQIYIEPAPSMIQGDHDYVLTDALNGMHHHSGGTEILGAPPPVTSFPTVGSSSCNDNAYGITQNLMNCILGIIDAAANTLIGSIISNIFNITHTAIIIALMFFGIRVVFGAASLKKDGFIFVAKALIIAAIVEDPLIIISYREWITDGSIALGNLVMGGVQSAAGSSGTLFPAQSCNQTQLFERLDCVVFELFGLGGAGSNSVGLSAVIAGLFFTPIGGLLVLMAISYILSIIFFIYHTVVIYLLSIIAITILMALAPVILPFMFFEFTKRITVQWFQFILSYTLMPVILTAFLAIMLLVVENISNELESFYTINNDSSSVNYSYTDQGIIHIPVKIDPAAPSSASLIAKQQGKQTVSAWYSPVTTGVSSWVGTQWKNVKLSVKAKALSFVEGFFVVKILNWTEAQQRDFIALIGASIVLMILMVSYMKDLPQQVDRMVATSALTGLNQFTGLINKAENIAQKGVMGGARGIQSAGQRGAMATARGIISPIHTAKNAASAVSSAASKARSAITGG